MKRINEVFTDEEFKQLTQIKQRTDMNWHDFIIESAKRMEN